MTAIDQAYAEVQRVTRARAKNFAYGIMVLPREKRRPIAAIYAFAREVDDIADGKAPAEEKRALLESFRARLDEPPTDSAFIALTDTPKRLAIPRAPLAALAGGGWQELDRNWERVHGLNPGEVDERLRRLWRPCLWSCVEMFRPPHGKTHLFQIVVSKGNVGDAYPMSRAFLYSREQPREQARAAAR